MALLGAFLYSRLLARFEQLPPIMSTNSNDIATYRRAGEGILAGELPYRDFFIEYPPGGLPFFVPPAALSEYPWSYAGYFASEMALVLIATLVLTALAARRLRGWWAWPLPALVFTAGALLLYPVAVTRYDPVVALTLSAAILGAASGGRTGNLLAWASLGFGAVAKLVPALAVPALAAISGRRATITGSVVFLAVIGVFALPAILSGATGLERSLEYHAERGLQIESVAASLLIKLGLVRDAAFQYGAFEVLGGMAEFASGLSLPATGALLILTAAAMYAGRRNLELEAGWFPRWAAAFVLAFIIGSKVLSPQYMIWLLPLVPLAACGFWSVGVSGILLAACWLTTQVYPVYYGELMQLRPPGTDLLLARNLLLVILWALLVTLPAGKLRTASGGDRP